MTHGQASVLGKVLFIVGAAGVLAATRRIDDPLLASGNIACAAMLVIASWINTTVKIARRASVASANEELPAADR